MVRAGNRNRLAPLFVTLKSQVCLSAPKKSAHRVVPFKPDGGFVRPVRFDGGIDPCQQFRARRPIGLVFGEARVGVNAAHRFQRRFRPLHLGNRKSAVDYDDRRIGKKQERVVEL